ncbi:hypothetical protein MX572_02085 [Rhodococcus pyridinivorans]|uniref:hypothetical protein n=1 Tax=Rhodococcus pyridinivorans TaxID=103816 RepID=UPI0020C5CA7E|nr:hypothetical protein [Rhodococcus pyridinivorans]UTM37642.1 hypothetical protein MX572_02085 [Rhodococcus pyridinivorans]
MPKCNATTQFDNRGRGGKPCTRWAVNGSTKCFAHGGTKDTTTPEAVTTRPDNTRQPCNARRADGEPCGNYAMQGGTVCVKHGGRVPLTRQSAAARLLDLRLRAIGVVDGMLDDESLEPAVRLRAAQLVLDRTGLGPTSRIEHEVGDIKPYERLLTEVKRDVALPPGESDQIIEAEIEEEPTPTEPAKDSPAGKPAWDPNRKYTEPEPEPEPEENHVVVAFPRPPQRSH